MANKAIAKVQISRKRFFEVLKKRGSSIRKLGKVYELGRAERTIRRYVIEEKMPFELLNNIARHLDVEPNYLMGKYDDEANEIKNKYLQKKYREQITPENHPYILQTLKEIDYSQLFNGILTMMGISKEQFKTLDDIERVLFHNELRVAIFEVFAKHFEVNSIGTRLSETLEFYKAEIDDPELYFAEVEGVDLHEQPEPYQDNHADKLEEKYRKAGYDFE